MRLCNKSLMTLSGRILQMILLGVFTFYRVSFIADPKQEITMKQRYEEILNTTTGGYRIEVKRNFSKFIVLGMRHSPYQKKND